MATEPSKYSPRAAPDAAPKMRKGLSKQSSMGINDGPLDHVPAKVEGYKMKKYLQHSEHLTDELLYQMINEIKDRGRNYELLQTERRNSQSYNVQSQNDRDIKRLANFDKY